jgi:hypothetical protein
VTARGREAWKTTGILNDEDKAQAAQVAADLLGHSNVLGPNHARELRLRLLRAGIGHTGPMDEPIHAFHAEVARQQVALALEKLPPGDAIALAEFANMLLAYPTDAQLWQTIKAQEEHFTKHVLPGLRRSYYSARAKRGAATRRVNRQGHGA